MIKTLELYSSFLSTTSDSYVPFIFQHISATLLMRTYVAYPTEQDNSAHYCIGGHTVGLNPKSCCWKKLLRYAFLLILIILFSMRIKNSENENVSLQLCFESFSQIVQHDADHTNYCLYLREKIINFSRFQLNDS